MKRISTFALSVLLCLSLFTFDITAHDQITVNSTEAATVQNVCERFLSGRVYYIYLGETNTTDQRTILDYIDEDTVDTSLGAVLANTSTDAQLSFYTVYDDYHVLKKIYPLGISVQNMEMDMLLLSEFTTYRNGIHKENDVAYDDFDASYSFGSIDINGNMAVAKVYEELNYRYAGREKWSYELNQYDIILIKIESEWIVADALTDDIFFTNYLASKYTNQVGTIEDEADEKELTLAISSEESLLDSQNTTLVDAARATTIVDYEPQNAKYYALTYTTSNDNGQATPTFVNSNFPWWNSDCMNFASQCIWAGFGGSDTRNDILNAQAMDKSTSSLSQAYEWWATANPNVTANSNHSSSSWRSCAAFKTYVQNSKNSTEKGMHCDFELTGCNKQTIEWSYSTDPSDLIGSVMLVRGSTQNEDGTYIPVKQGHAVFVNDADSFDRTQIYVSCYNSCKKDVQLSIGWKHSSNSVDEVYTIRPRYFKGVESAPRVWGDLVDNVTPSSLSRTLVAHGNQTFATLRITLQRPSGTIARQWYANNTYKLTAAFSDWTFSGDQKWQYIVHGTLSNGQTVSWCGTIRVKE